MAGARRAVVGWEGRVGSMKKNILTLVGVMIFGAVTTMLGVWATEIISVVAPRFVNASATCTVIWAITMLLLVMVGSIFLSGEEWW